MLIVEPKVEYWEQKDPILHVAHCAQVCYQSKPKDKEASKKFYKGLISSGHVSMLRHESCYFIIPWEELGAEWIENWEHNPYIEIAGMCDGFSNMVFISTNANFLLDHKNVAERLNSYKVSPEEFKKECPELMRYTFCLTTQISTSRELNRVSPNNIAEMSTRYIKFSGKVEPSIVRPWWMAKVPFMENNKYFNVEIAPNGTLLKEEIDYMFDEPWYNTIIYLNCCKNSFREYSNLLGNGMKPEDARGVLPLDTMTKVIYTYSIKEWSHILGLRLLDKTGKAHGNCHIICQMVYDELQKLGYKFNENNELE